MDKSEIGGPGVRQGNPRPDDAERVVELGADGSAVSNHGDRQLNATLPALEALPANAERVSTLSEILFDGGIRSGILGIITLALGARACLIGLPLSYCRAGGGHSGRSRSDQDT